MNERAKTQTPNTAAGRAPAGTAREATGGGTARLMPGRLTYYHPNARGTGTAMQLELRLNRAGEDRYDCFFLELARQKTAPSAPAATDGRRMPASFDWAAKLTAKLDFADVCEFLMVLEGRQPQAGGDRNGLYHGNGGGSTLISFRRSEEPKGYHVGLSKKGADGAEAVRAQILLGDAEALGLRHVLQTSLFFMTFHANLRG